MGFIHKVRAVLERSTKAGAILAASLLYVTLGATDLKAGPLTVSQPTLDRIDVVQLYDKDGKLLVAIKVRITASMTPTEKARAIESAISAAGYGANSAGDEVYIDATKGVAGWKFISRSGELDTSGQAIGPGPFSLGFEGSLSGIGIAGHPASYTAGVGFDIGGSAIFASSIITYASLSNRTLNGLLTLTYDNLEAGLPLVDRSLLSLNLSTDTITFTAPVGATNVYVQSLSYDAMTGSTVGGTAVTPEPSTAWLALTGAGLIFGAAKFRHRRPNRKAIVPA
jgi:hypothetical protein